MRRLLLTAATTAAALTLAACGTTEPAADKSEKPSEAITLTDSTGKKVELDGPATKVVATEWNEVEFLVTLGVDPVGVADVKGYKTWDQAVPLKNEPKDIGTRGEPSMDTVAALAPDLIVASSDLPPAAVKQLRQIAPVLGIQSADASDQIGKMLENLDLIARATGTTDQAKTVREGFEAKVDEGRKALADAGLDGTDIAFADGYVTSNQVSLRPYTSGSLIGAVNERIGLKNAWKVEGDADYGLGTTDVEGLTDLPKDVQFAYIGNDEDDTSTPFTGALAKNAVWTSLPFVNAGDVHRLPDGIWMFGGPESMEAYIDAVVDALTKK
ncbi:iron-siderophore ABC transporter substrate-binding protein [Streptomyces europaeiscabiei]|uniref:Iron-siderophore ABC transporter substrate-binding protein n=1 Tax=Streptomyces europaeiscabiei TaxID=146819 RepID=A0ABU4NMN1_9ACTN|nr:iron-siderophore ABC transporter substrate-binding protein [Streptomyces europaeiscabiei]MDX2528956.1 iron-siderophore ABC transporter substrate-binding protein [Streptomyces europaeiscabiei]MDX2759385.1 iron-siderophore ABC transporter substrate-binding protein [Streptomyces europaeiscabiei]MDX2769399.1 iron-siderophore ABC transporter substrate-binding protein [Streptomyces europaeiscabiei]MDX3546737.1 iron-siderophore ABC transporter substrate-binding protein [Streptomyces europaeiscabiei